MTSTTRTALSVAIFLALVSFSLSSAILAGPFAITTVVAFSLLIPYNLFGIAALSYSGPHYVRLRGK